MRDYEVVKDLLVPRDLIDVKVRKQILEKLQPYLDFVFQKFYETLIQNRIQKVQISNVVKIPTRVV